jgi:hypothetical protein
MHPQYDFVGIPECEEVHARRKDKRNHRSAHSAETIAQAHEKRGHRSQQHQRLETVHLAFRPPGSNVVYDSIFFNRMRAMSQRKPGERPANVKPPAHLSKSPPIPTPSEPVATAEAGGRDGPDPTRYGDWENKGIAVDF